MTAFYNEIDPYAAQWLRNLIAAGQIAPGVVDTRSIEDITPDELQGFAQVHFFAGIGVWSYALRQAGWPDDRPVWTGSCPCQPFSAAGKGAGFADERHLWPSMYHLANVCRPPVIFGEQVASNDGLEWSDLVQIDLENAGYSAGIFDLCAAGIGAPHIRQRLYWVANANDRSKPAEQALCAGGHAAIVRGQPGGMANANNAGSQGRISGRPDSQREDFDGYAGRNGAIGGLADSNGNADQRQERGSAGETRRRPVIYGASLAFSGESGGNGANVFTGFPDPLKGQWAGADWLLCRDGKFRAVESGAFPLANGTASRVGRLRAYGNAVTAQVAETFIRAYMDAANDDFYQRKVNA